MAALATIYDRNGNGLIEFQEFSGAFLQANAFAPTEVPKQGSKHVDHSLEMWRAGHAMGGSVGHHGSYSHGYRYDGKIDHIGEGDTDGAPTVQEMERAHDAIRDYAHTRWGNFRKAFNALDEDRSGKVSKLEFLRILMHANLPIREKTMEALANLYDTNHNGMIDYKEFSHALTHHDAHHVHKPLPSIDGHHPMGKEMGHKGRHIFVPGSGVMYCDKPARPKESHHFVPGDGPKYTHVDQALEMWREGQAAGGGNASRFDGKVNDVGASDNDPPPTQQDVERAHDQIRNYMMNHFDNYRKAFQKLDEDRSGKVNKLEFLRILMMANLQIREKTISALVDVYDKNKSGEIDYEEFCANFMNKEDAM